MTYPILANDGRTVIGHAKTESGAKRCLMNTLGDHSTVLIKRHKFHLNVRLREHWLAEINGGPVGWMYSIGK